MDGSGVLSFTLRVQREEQVRLNQSAGWTGHEMCVRGIISGSDSFKILITTIHGGAPGSLCCSLEEK